MSNVNIAENIRVKNTKNVCTKEVKLVPLGARVIFKPYDDNPYRKIEMSEEGVVFGIESTKRYVSNDSGEMEDNETAILCAKVISAGPDCKWVHDGDDIFVTAYLATPVPYRNLGYKCIDEHNVMCKIERNDD